MLHIILCNYCYYHLKIQVLVNADRNLMKLFVMWKCCSLHDQIFKPSKLPGNADFHLFKDGVEPKWEDPECASGGKWTLTSKGKGNLDTMWLETVMCLFSLICFCV